MVIKMNADKSLQITKTDVIYQGENNANSVVFFIPKNIGNISIENADVTVKYILPDNSEITRVMKVAESEYLNYIECTEPISSDLTVYSGIVVVSIQIKAKNEITAKSGSAAFLVNEQHEHVCHC